MRTLMINSSFRKNGNTQKILYKIGEQLQGEVDYINLHDYDINECKGCYQCMVKDEFSCPNQDELNIVLKKMMNADLIVFGSPVYGRQINSTMKKFYDRITYHFHKPIFYDKKVINVAATELMGHGSTLKYMKLVSDNLAMRFIGNVSFSERFSFKNKNYHSKLDKRILNIVSKAEVDDHTPTMKQRIIFNKWKIRSILYQGKSDGDYAYWNKKGWLTQKYYVETHGKHIQSFIASNIIYHVMFFMVSKLTGFKRR